MDATRRSLEGFRDDSVLLILGGRSKGAEISGLSEMVERKVRRAFFIGEAAEEFERALGGVVASAIVRTLPEAVTAAGREARSGEAVVLSPACASFDQYVDFRERGLHFQSLVAEIESDAATHRERGGGVG